MADTRPEKPATCTACFYPGPDERPCPPCVWLGCVRPYVPPEDAEVVTKGKAPATTTTTTDKANPVPTETLSV